MRFTNCEPTDSPVQRKIIKRINTIYNIVK